MTDASSCADNEKLIKSKVVNLLEGNAISACAKPSGESISLRSAGDDFPKKGRGEAWK